MDSWTDVQMANKYLTSLSNANQYCVEACCVPIILALRRQRQECEEDMAGPG
jgi:hypothetical protein